MTRSKIRYGLTECRGSMQRVGPRRQSPRTFRRDADGTEHWETYCDRCGTYQHVINHEMVRHNTEGSPYNAAEHVATKFRQSESKGDSTEYGEPLF